MEKLSFRREHSLRHNFLYVDGIQKDEKNYENKMLLNIEIPGALKLQHVQDGENEASFYEISSLCSLLDYFEKRRITEIQLCDFVEHLNRLLLELEGFLISEDHILLHPEAIFVDEEKDAFVFALVPERKNAFAKDLQKLMQWILKRIDYTSDSTIVLAYRLSQQVSKEFVQMDDLLKSVERTRLLTREKCRSNSGDILSGTKEFSEENGAFLDSNGIFRWSKRHSGMKYAETEEIQNELRMEKETDRVFKVDKIDDNIDKSSSSIRETSRKNIDELLENIEEEKKERFLRDEDYEIDLNSVEIKSRKRSYQKNQFEGKKQSILKYGGGILFMLLLPLVIYFLEGKDFLVKYLPLVLIVEVGVLTLLILDLIMNKMPDD